jgi:hypothetical protein
MVATGLSHILLWLSLSPPLLADPLLTAAAAIVAGISATQWFHRLPTPGLLWLLLLLPLI